MSVLGLTWDSQHDTLSFQEAQRVPRPLTKRKCLSFTAGIYDPLGLLIYATSPCMSFITKLWSQELDWDDILTPDLCEEWASLEEKAILASKTVLKDSIPSILTKKSTFASSQTAAKNPQQLWPTSNKVTPQHWWVGNSKSSTKQKAKTSPFPEKSCLQCNLVPN